MEYIFVLVWIGILAVFAKYVNVQKTELVDGVEITRYNWIFAFIAFLPIVFIAANRPANFTDTSAYRVAFNHMPDTFNELPSYLSDKNKDQGFYFISSIIRILITKDATVYFYIIAAFQGIALVYLYRNYSPSYLVSLFLFVASADYVMWMCNGVRQFLAVTIILFATPFILKRKYIPAIAIILLASTMHRSALIMIPIIFIIQGDVWNKRTVLFIIAVIIVIVFVDQFTSFLDDTLSGTQYQKVVSDTEKYGYKGTNFLRVAVYSIPATLSFIFRKKINEEGSTIIKISANMSIISSGLYIVSMFTSGMFIGRLPIYCSLYGYIFLPWIIMKTSDEKAKGMIYFLMVVMYLIYYYVQVHIHFQLF